MSIVTRTQCRSSLTRLAIALCGASFAGLVCLTAPALAAGPGPYISNFSTTTTLASTVPAIGDQNPYGIVTAPRTIGSLHAGDILVSNFNNEGPTQRWPADERRQPGRGHDDRAVQPRRHRSPPVRADRPDTVPGWSRPDDGARRAARRLRDRRQPADDRRDVGDDDGRRADHPQPPRPRRRRDRRRTDQRALGHDVGQRRTDHDAVRHQRVERDGRSQPGAPSTSGPSSGSAC